MSDFHDSIQAALEQHQPMVDGWVLAYETTTLREDGGLGGEWAYLSNTSSSNALGLMTIASASITHRIAGVNE